jgi:trimethyllysine dioxygenase
MEAKSILVMNNWRVLDGRAGGRASPDRHVVGGTIVREAIYLLLESNSAGSSLARKQEYVDTTQLLENFDALKRPY